MSKIDTYLNIDQSIRLRGLSKISEAQLQVALQNNNELQKLRAQLSSDINQLHNLIDYQNEVQEQALLLQKQILENQIKEIEHKEIQKFHKQRLFQCKEYVNDYFKLSDTIVKTYFRTNFLLFTEQLIIESKSTLEEINDKEFAFKLQEEIKKILSEKENNGNDPLLATLTDISNKLLSERLTNDKYKEEKESLNELKYSLENIKGGNEENFKMESTRMEKIYKRRKLWAFIFGAWIIIAGIIDLTQKTFAFRGYIILIILFALFFILALKANKNITDFKKSNNFEEEEQYNEIVSKFRLTVKHLIASSRQLTELKNEYDSLVIKLLEVHPEFKLIDYAFA